MGTGKGAPGTTTHALGWIKAIEQMIPNMAPLAPIPMALELNIWKSKLPPIPDHQPNLEEWVNLHVQKSLEILEVNNLSALLLHRPYQLFDKDKNGYIEADELAALIDLNSASLNS